ncbi:hypothetical protein [Tessaracoccus sp.]
MVWVMVVIAIAVLGVAAWAGTGRLGEMPPVVGDRPKGHIPEGPVDGLFLQELSLPVVGVGYRCSQVDDTLASHVAGDASPVPALFDVVRRGYDMQAVDAVLDRLQGHDVPARSDEDFKPPEQLAGDTREDLPASGLHYTEQ